jgi:DNA-binding MarR family transcriptional regulator
MQFMPGATPDMRSGRVLPAGRAACHCALLRRTARRVTQLYDEALAPAGIRLTQYSLLATVEREGSIALTPLAGALGMDRTTLTRNLAPLVARKLLVLENAKGRTKLVRLTARGAKLLLAAYPHWLVAQRTFAKRLGTSEAATLAALDSVLS